MTEEEINRSYHRVVEEFEDIHLLMKTRPYLAHYTSISTVESIIGTRKIWFSNPLFMNDLEEMRAGIHEGMTMLLQKVDLIKYCDGVDRAELLKRQVVHYYTEFATKHALDTYVFCLSEHDIAQTDGRLSMWRAYGGQGSGAAIVFNTSFVTFNEFSSMIITKVHYKNLHDRLNWLHDHLSKYLNITKELSLPDDKLYIAAFHIFNLFKIFSLSFKHEGFVEEREWRVIYLPDRDINKKLANQFSYNVGPRGVEPKLKFLVAPLDPEKVGDLKLEDIIEQIIIGPSVPSPKFV